MVLYIDENNVESIPKTLQEFLNLYQSLHDKSKSFTSLPVQSVDPLYSLYVGQSEYAVIPNYESILKVVGSDDATTCHIIILKDSFGCVGVAHFDGNIHECESLQRMTSELKSFNGNSEECVDVYIVGGYRSDSENITNNSETLSLNLLKYLCNMNISFNLQLLCTVDLNTKIIDGNPYPLFYGIAFNRETGQIFPANFAVPVPNHIIRSARMWVAGPQPSRNIYDYENNIVAVSPFENWNRKDFKFYSTLPSHIILKYFSTSPLVEPPSFVSRLRSVFTLLGSYSSDEIFPENKPKIYKIISSGDWKEI